MTSAALKLDFPDFSVIFGRNCPSKNPIPLGNHFFFQFCHIATCHSFHMTPRCLKNMVPGVRYEPKSKYTFFRKNHLIFLPSTCLTGYFKVLIWTYGWFLWPKLVLRHLRNCPRVKLEIIDFWPGNPIS